MTISYLEAWRVWFSGEEVDPQAQLWFMSVRWWGRAGKIMGFLGGATVILDLIGPERLRAIGNERSLSSAAENFANRHLVLLVRVALLLLAAILVYGYATDYGRRSHLPFDSTVLDGVLLTVLVFLFASLVVTFILKPLPTLISRLLDTHRPALILRYLGLVLLFVGFHFDLLAS